MGDKLQFWLMFFLAFLIPTLSLFAPLGIASCFVVMALYPSIVFVKNGKIKNIWSEKALNKIIIVLLIYSFISALWAIKPNEAVNLAFRMTLFFIGSLSLLSYIPQINDKEKILKSLLAGVILAIIVANFEIFSAGYLTRFFLTALSHPAKNDYVVELNRGSSVLSVMSWAVILYLCNRKQYKAAIGLYIASFLTVCRLESFSSVIAILLAGLLIFPVVYYKGRAAMGWFAKLAVVAVIVVATTGALMDAHKLVGNVPVIAGAASDIRLYIWDYASKQALKKPVFGWGFNSSRSYPVLEKDYVQGGRSPLPLHPHNNTIQVWLELGAVGLVMFAAFLSLIILRIRDTIHGKYALAAFAALFVNYFAIGQTAYGVCQNWWVASGILACAFLKLCYSERKAEL